MINFKLAKAAFFDQPVVRHLDRVARQVLSRFGAFVRTTARRSLKPAPRGTVNDLPTEPRQRFQLRLRLWAAGRLDREPRPPRRSSRAGRPPFYRHPQSPIRRILFFYDRETKSVAVGPVAFGPRGGEATAALEYGGRSTNYDRRAVTLSPRPFMAPAFDTNLPHLRRWKAAA